MALASGIKHWKNIHEHIRCRIDFPFRACDDYLPKELKTLTTAERPVLRMW